MTILLTTIFHWQMISLSAHWFQNHIITMTKMLSLWIFIMLKTKINPLNQRLSYFHYDVYSRMLIHCSFFQVSFSVSIYFPAKRSKILIIVSQISWKRLETARRKVLTCNKTGLTIIMIFSFIALNLGKTLFSPKLIQNETNVESEIEINNFVHPQDSKASKEKTNYVSSDKDIFKW